VYLKFIRNRVGPSDQPLLNRRGEQLVGQVYPLEQAIVDGRGRLKIGDAFWVAEGPDLPQGTRVRVLAVRSMSLQVGPAE
jgi:membrane protein implicated in regulation of membrane protease activity